MTLRRCVGTLASVAALVLAFVPRAGRAADAITPMHTLIEHARIATGDGTVIENGSLLLSGQKIAALGADGKIAVPAGARRIDGRGAWVTPGLVDAEAATGLVDVNMEGATVEVGLDDRYDAVRAAFTVVDGLNPAAIAIPITRMEGITASVLAPRNGLVAGRGAVVRLDGDRIDDMLVRTPIAIYASVSESGRNAAFGARGGAFLRLRELFDDVRQYMRRRADFERNQMRRVAASRLDLEALVPVVEGKLPLVVEVHRASDIQATLRLARDEKLRVILSGAEEGWMVASEIAAAGVPVVVSALPDLPRSFEALGARLENAAWLDQAGVKIAISPRERGEHKSRTLRIEAGNAVANGLAWARALHAVTRAPAEMFGVGGEIGELAPGRQADVVVWSGDPFEPLSRVRQLFIRGRDVPLRSRQTDLRERYRDLRGARP